MKKLKDKLNSVETELKKKNEKVIKLEAEIQDIHKKISEKDQTVSKINKKFNFLKEKVTLLFDLDAKVDTIEKRIENINDISVNTIENVQDTQTVLKTDSESAGDTGQIKCDLCEFVAKNKFGLKIHFHKKHSSAKFKCFTCDFTCMSHS